MSKFRKEPFITQRQGRNGQWTFQVYIRADDATITKSFNEKTYGSAKLAFETAVLFRDKTRYDIANNTILKAQNVTVAQIFEESIENSSYSFNTKNKHIKVFKKYITTKDIPIQQLNKAHIISNLNSLTGKCTDDCIARVYSVYKNDIINYALNCEYIAKDLMAGIKKPKSRIVKQKKSTVTDRQTILEVERILLSSKANRYNSRLVYYLMEILYYTGMRPAEAEVLTRDDITDGYISVNKQLGSNNEEKYVVTNCKTPTSVRLIPIHPNLKPLLEELFEYSKTHELFLREDGRYLNSDYIGTLFHNLLKKHNINFNLYMLRHHMATSLVTNGTDSKTTMEILGHAQYNMSLGYANSSSQLKKDAIKLLS